MKTRNRPSIMTIRNASEDSHFCELLHLDTIPTERKDYLFSPKEFNEDWFIEWKEYIFTLATNELVLTPFDGSYNYKLLNISMLHVLEVLSAISTLPLSQEVYNQVLKEHVENMARSCGIEAHNFDYFKSNFDLFMDLYEKRMSYVVNSGAEEIELNNEATSQFRASKIHLIFGKIVGDALGLHPALGALLNPTGGIVGPNNSNIFYRAWSILPSFKKNGIIHDATGYLRYYHGVGPGYKYLDKGDITGRLTPINGVLYGLKLPRANLGKYFKWEMVDVRNTIAGVEGNDILTGALIIILIYGCFLVLSLIL